MMNNKMMFINYMYKLMRYSDVIDQLENSPLFNKEETLQELKDALTNQLDMISTLFKIDLSVLLYFAYETNFGRVENQLSYVTKDGKQVKLLSINDVWDFSRGRL